MKRTKKGWVLLLMLLLVNVVSYAQQIRVVNEMFEVIENVSISNVTKSKELFTDEKGRANLSAFNINDTLTFDHPSYKREKLPVSQILQEGGWVYMEHLSNMLKGVAIVAPLRKEIKELRKSPNQSEIITADKLEKLNAQTTADVLQNTGAIQVQKSQMGGGSPIIRGFEANRVLLVIDGVRMNNAIYRSGHLQNSVTIDNNVLSQVEVQYGPGSATYGSDAIGGVVHFHTKDPKFSKGDSVVTGGSAFIRYNSSNSEKTGHFDISVGSEKWGGITSVSVSDFGDLKMGNNRLHGYDDFGKINYYADRIGEQDSMLVNTDPNMQIGSGYKQIDALQKIVYKPSDKLLLRLNTQYSTSTDIPRYDRLNNFEDGELEYAEWYYGPQERLLASLVAELSDSNRLFSKASFIASFQKLNEDRVKRKFGKNSRSYNLEDVNVYALNLDLVKEFNAKNNLFYGAEITHNDVVSKAYTKDIISGEIGEESTRYPDAGSSMTTAAVYLNHTRTTEKLITNMGVRYNYNNLTANFEDTNFVHLPFSEISAVNTAASGSLGALLKPIENIEINANISTGFRSPNIDDFGKVFKKADNVVIPNNNIAPEFAYSGEIGISKTFQRKVKEYPSLNLKRHLLTFHGTVFYTLLDNAIVREDYTLNGEDSLVYEGENRKIQVNTNVERAAIYGVNFGLKATFTRNFHLTSSINYTKGVILDDNSPFGHIPPVFGRTGLFFEKDNWDVEFYSEYNGWKKIEDYTVGSTDNPSEATTDGTPSWYTFNLRASLSLSNAFTVQLAAYNLMDVHYKKFASGISSPGRSIMVTGRIFF